MRGKYRHIQGLEGAIDLLRFLALDDALERHTMAFRLKRLGLVLKYGGGIRASWPALHDDLDKMAGNHGN